MITILPDKDYKNCKLINKTYADNVFVFTAKDGDEYLGFGVAAMYDDYAEIVDVVTADGMESLEHGIFKSLLNFIERREIYDCICALDKPAMLKRLGFSHAEEQWQGIAKVNGSVFYLNLTRYFEKHC